MSVATIEEFDIDTLLSDTHSDTVDKMERRLRTLLGVLAKGEVDDGFSWSALHAIPAWQPKCFTVKLKILII